MGNKSISCAMDWWGGMIEAKSKKALRSLPAPMSAKSVEGGLPMGHVAEFSTLAGSGRRCLEKC
jgi:hypothetical protein